MGAVKPVNGITKETYNRLLLDSGAVYLNYGKTGEKLIGATRGGNTCVIEQENRDMTVDGAPGPVKGSERRLRTTAKLTVNLIEHTTDAIKRLLPGSVSAVENGKDVITRNQQIAIGDYLENITLVLEKNGTSELFAFQLDNAIALGNYELGAAEDDESVMTLEFTAHFDPDNLEQEPWSIFNPLESGTDRFALTYIAGDHGSIVGDASQNVASGENGTAVYASAENLYEFDQWSDASTDNPRTDTSVAANITVTASFTLI